MIDNSWQFKDGGRQRGVLCQDLGHQREATFLVSLGSAGNLFHKPTRLLGSGDFLMFRFFFIIIYI